MIINDLIIGDDFINLPLNDKQDNIRLLLEFNSYYTSSDRIMNLYCFLDEYSRAKISKKTFTYKGSIPIDFSIYLSFFEVLYVAVATKAIDISLVDSLFRFRFFAACNNPLIQKSELLPLSYQYPNVFDLYALWAEYIRLRYISNNKSSYYLDEMALFENDLIKRVSAYNIINRRINTEYFRLVNSKASKIDVSVQRLNSSHYEQCLLLQTELISEIKGKFTYHIFEPLTEQEIKSNLEIGSSFGVFNNDKLIAITMFIENAPSGYTLLNDIADFANTPVTDVLVIDCIIVKKEFRGYGIQSFFLDIARHLAEKNEIEYVCAVVSPHNKYSSSNFEKYGFYKIATLPKYHSMRDYYLLKLAL